MYTQEALRLGSAFESPHAPLSKSRCFVRLLRPVVRVSVRNVMRVRNQFPMGDPITAQFVGYDFPGLGSMTSYQSAEKPLGGPRIPSTLEQNIDDIPVLVNSTP